MVRAGASAGPGTAALVEGGRVDFARLRADRRARLLEAMAGAGIDALVLGRPANIAYAAGTRSLWTAGSRPFGPGVVLAATGEIHLQSTWDDGVPGEISRDSLFGLSWNPVRITANVAGAPGLSGARRVGTDGWTPGAAGLLGAAAPGAEVVDASALLGEVRSVKTEDELACLRTAAAAAEAGLAAVIGALAPGISERQLAGVHAAALARLGLPTPPVEGAACFTETAGPIRRRRLASARTAVAGQLAVLTGAALYSGYEASLSRTWLVGDGPATEAQRRLVAGAQSQLEARIGACRGGPVDPARLGPAVDAGGEPVAWGVGLGLEEPLLGAGLGAGARLRDGSTLVVQAWDSEAGIGGALESDTVLVTEDRGRRLTTFPGCPALAS